MIPADFEGFHLLQIPVRGPYHLYHSDMTPDEQFVTNLLRTDNEPRDESPVPAKIEAKMDDLECVVWFVPDPTLPLNLRARDVVADKFGWHMVFHGSVVIDGLDTNTVARMVAE